MALFKLIIEWLSILAIPVIFLFFLGFGYVKRVKVYEISRSNRDLIPDFLIKQLVKNLVKDS